MDKQFIYCDNPQAIELLKQSYEIFCQNDNGCYFINKSSDVAFDESLICDFAVYTDSISLEL